MQSYMLPTIDIPAEVFKKLLSYKHIGEIVEEADILSLEMFKVLLTQNPHYGIEGISGADILEAVGTQTFSHIPFESSQKYIMLASDRQQFKRAIIYKVINSSLLACKVTSREKTLMNGFLQMASLFDQLFIQWRERVVCSDPGLSFAKDQNAATKFRKEHHLSTIPYVFSVIGKDEKDYFEETLVSAFPVIVKRIIEELRSLSESYTLQGGAVAMVNYINALADFYENDQADKYEYLSRALDMLWLKLEGKVIPIHSMEVYEDPGKYCVNPEFGLALLDGRYKAVNTGIEIVKKNMIAKLNESYGQLTSFQSSQAMMEHASAKVYSFVCEAGRRLTFRPYGQNIPNWEDIRKTNGIRIFIDMNSAFIRWNFQKSILEKLFGEETLAATFLPKIADKSFFKYATIVNVGGHEIAHNAFLAPSVQDRLTPPLYAKLEETKASFTILSCVMELYTPHECEVILMSELASDVMNLAGNKDVSKVAYVYTAIASMKALFQSGVMSIMNGKYLIDLQSEKVHDYFVVIKKMLDTIIGIYESGDELSAARTISDLFTPDESITSVMKLLAL